MIHEPVDLPGVQQRAPPIQRTVLVVAFNDVQSRPVEAGINFLQTCEGIDELCSSILLSIPA